VIKQRLKFKWIKGIRSNMLSNKWGFSRYRKIKWSTASSLNSFRAKSKSKLGMVVEWWNCRGGKSRECKKGCSLIQTVDSSMRFLEELQIIMFKLFLRIWKGKLTSYNKAIGASLLKRHKISWLIRDFHKEDISKLRIRSNRICNRTAKLIESNRVNIKTKIP
jgi:hypothetical protein